MVELKPDFEPIVRRAVDQIFHGDLQYIGSNEPELASLFLDSIEDPLRSLHEMGLTIFAVEITGPSRVASALGEASIPHWTTVHYLVVPQESYFRCGDSRSQLSVHRFVTTCERAIADLAEALTQEKPIAVWVGIEAVTRECRGNLRWCRECCLDNARVQVEDADLFDEPTGWVNVDGIVGEIRRRLKEASTEAQFQAIGLLCREALISLAQSVFDPNRHKPADQVESSSTDAKRMLEAYLAAELRGRANEVARRSAKAALDLANELQHRRTATFREAARCAEATKSLVNLVAIISGRHDPNLQVH
jgi:hypothetical protein